MSAAVILVRRSSSLGRGSAGIRQKRAAWPTFSSSTAPNPATALVQRCALNLHECHCSINCQGGHTGEGRWWSSPYIAAVRVSRRTVGVGLDTRIEPLLRSPA